MTMKSFTSLMLTCLQTTGAENLTRRAAIETETDIVGADTRITRTAPAEAVVKRTESADTATMTRGGLIDLELKMRDAAVDNPFAKTSLDTVAIVMIHAVRPMLSLKVLMVLTSQEPEATVVTRMYDHANLARLRSPLHVAFLKKMRAESAGDDLLVLILLDAIDLIRLNRLHPQALLPEHPDEIVASLPTTVLEVLVVNAARRRSRLLTTSAKQTGRNDEQEKKVKQDVNLLVTGSQYQKAKAKNPHVNPHLSLNLSSNRSQIDDIAAHVGTAIPAGLGMKSPRSALEKSQLYLKRSSTLSGNPRASWVVLRHHAKSLQLPSLSENEQETPRQRAHLSALQRGTGAPAHPLMSRALGPLVAHAMSPPLNHPETKRGRRTRRKTERETRNPRLDLPSTSEWTRRTPAAKHDTKSGVGLKSRRKTRSHRASRGRSRSYSVNLERPRTCDKGQVVLD